MVTLIILDGFGYREEVYGNAIKQAGTPNLDRLLQVYPHTLLAAHGEAVGLEEGQMGGSEVGHLNIGAGRKVYQELTKLNNAIKDGSFAKNAQLVAACKHAKKNGSKLHLMGLLSNGGIHSNINHLKALVDMAEQYGLENVYIHAFMDGRDTLKDSGIDFVKEINEYVANKHAKVASVVGRVYAMDRELRWDRQQKAYDMLVHGKADNHYDTAEEAVLASYENGVFDEFMEPAIVGEGAKIEDGDSVIFFNFRADRARQITRAIAEKDVAEMPLKQLKDIYFVGLTQYNKNFKKAHAAYFPEVVENNLASIISAHGLKQLHISETTKYAHVTFFLNGGIEEAYAGEDRVLIESYNVKDFKEVPQMKAQEITDATIEAIKSVKYDFIIVNLSNADMVGHSGEMEATIQSIKVVEKCAYDIAVATLAVGGHAVITADHGNAEEMLDARGNAITAHSLNSVPFILVSDELKNVDLAKSKSLSNIAPTVLKLMGLDVPKYMDEALFWI